MKRTVLALSVAMLTVSAQAADYPAFLRAQFAASEGNLPRAANEILRALKTDPNNSDLEGDAFALSVLADRPEADELALDVSTTPAAELLRADISAKRGDWREAELGYAEIDQKGPAEILRPMLVAWSQQAQGRTERALQTLAPLVGDQHAGVLFLLQAAVIADLAHRDGQAGRLYDALAKTANTGNWRVAAIIASWQARSGDRDAARATIGKMLAASPDAAIAGPALLDHVSEPAVRNATDGIAESYVAVASTLRGDGSADFATMLLHLALRMRPGFAPAELLLSDLEADHHHLPAAVDALRNVSVDDPLAALVQLRHASLEARLGHLQTAKQILGDVTRAHPDRPEPLAQLGDLLAGEKKYADAIAAYDSALDRIATPAASDWVLFFARGSAYERLHDWPHSEADMRRALALAPNQPYILNFLGYSMAERNQNLPEARQMIERALQQRPDDGAIIDSLGWVTLMQGDAAGARKLLERASEMIPDDPSITGHLGDALWQLGRHVEAEDQWRRALVLGPDEDDRARIEQRLRSASAAAAK